MGHVINCLMFLIEAFSLILFMISRSTFFVECVTLVLIVVRKRNETKYQLCTVVSKKKLTFRSRNYA